MANVNSPFGLNPIGRMDGGSPTAGMTKVNILYSAGPFYRGDPLIPLNTGYYTIYDPSGGATVQIAGVFWGCEYLSAAIGRKVWSNYYPASGQASGDVTAYLITDPDQLFVIQSDGTTAIAVSDINGNAPLVAGAGNTTTQLSGFTLNHSGITTTDTLPVRIVGLWSQFAPPGTTNGVDNTAAYNWVVVAPNNWSRKQLSSVG